MEGSAFEIRLLGRFVVLRDGREVPPSAFGGRLARRLVRVLAAHRGEHVPKDVLVEALWPQRAPSDPVANLEVLVSRTRRALGDPTLLLTGPGGYTLVADARCRIDADDVRAAVDRGREALRAGRPGDALVAFEDAIARWGGEPLAEDLYEDWAGPFRARLREAFQLALEEGAEAALGSGDPRRAAALAEQAAYREPLREAAAVALVRSLAATGDRAAALHAFERFRTRIADELGLDPGEEATALQASILRGESVAPAAAAAVAHSLVPSISAELPFVGRETELARALAGRVCLVTGPTGSGKSRFLDEIARRADVPVLRATAVLPERDEPWSLARSILREATALDALVARSLPALPATALADVLPELADPDGRASGIDRESRRALATEGGRLLLDAVAGSGALLLVDDLQWADGTSLHLLAVAAVRVGSLRLVLAHRPDQARAPDPASDFLNELARGGEVVRIELGALGADALERLAGDAVVARAIEAGTTATPLVAAEAIRLLEERGALGADASGRRRPLREIPPSEAEDVARAGQQRAARARVERLDRTERAILEALAALGRETAAATLASALGRESAEVLASLDALTRAGLVRLDERGWTFAHQSVADAVADGLEPGERMRVHAALCRVLEAEGADPSEVAIHAAAAGDAAAAIDGFGAAAERALARYANEESVRLAEAALELGPDGSRRTRLLAIRAEARARSGALDAAKADLRDALAAAPDDPDRADLLTRLALLESGSEDYEAAGRLVELALAAAGEDPRRRAEAHAVGAIVDLNLGDLEGSERRASTALGLFEANGDARGAAGILDGRAMATFLGGRIAEAAAAFDRVARLFRDAGELLRVGTPRSTRGHALVFLAEPGRGLTDIEEALELARSLGHAEGESYARWHRAEALAALGRGDEAVASATEALAIAERIRHREWTVASLRGLGIAHEATGELDRAIEAHRRGLEAAEGMPLFVTWAAARLASCLVRAGRLDEAATALERARPELAPLGAYEARLADAELRAARREEGEAAFSANAARIAEDGGHLVSAIRLRELAGAQPSA